MAVKRILKIIGCVFCITAIFVLAGLIVLFFLVNTYLKDLPEMDLSVLKNASQTSYIYDANGDVLATYSDVENRTWVALEDVPQDLIDAFVSTEDKRFYTHNGYDVKRILSAVISVVSGQEVHGGSTITQQLIKNAYLSSETTLKRKVQEIVLSAQLESMISKDEILEAYLNIIYLGGSNYGVAAAAKDYFNIDDLSQLTRKQCALIAGITQNPYYYDPRANYYKRDAFSRNEERISTVLYLMQTNGIITEEEYYEAMAEEIVIEEQSYSSNMYHYAHFIEYAVSDVIDGFIEYRGLEDTSENRSQIENEIRTGGYKIYTTLVPEIQEAVQDSISQYNNYPTFISSDDTNLSTEAQAAAVVIKQSTGEVVAMVGSRDEPTVKKSLNRAISNTMPIGSIIKPLSVYAPALESGLVAPGSPVLNIQSKIEGYDDSVDYPGGGVNPQGIVTLRYSLVNSLNVPTARLLCNVVGFNVAQQYLISLGIDEDSISMTGSGLALGSSGIDMLEVTGAYAAIANGGVYKAPRAYTLVTDSSGTVILNADSIKSERQVFSKSTAYMLTDMMEDVIESGTGITAKLANITAAGKTGTNEDNSLTFAGFTGYYTSALWIGNDSFLSFDDSVTSSTTVAPLWKEYMDEIHEGLEDKEIQSFTAEEAGLVKVTLCSVSGKLAHEFCSHGTTEDWVSAANVPTEVCDMHYRVDLCADTNFIATSDCPSTVQGTLTMLYVPENSDLFSIEREKILQLFPDAIIGKEELEQVLVNNQCLYHSSGYIYATEENFSETIE